jgi:hypothetical protein
MGRRPTVEFSCRERAPKTPSKTNDLAREAVDCMGMFGAPAAVVRVANRTHRPHPHVITPARRALGWDHAHLGSRPSGITRYTTGVHLNHAQHPIRLPTTGNPHNGPLNHACTTGNPHNGRPYHTLHNGHRHDGVGRTRLPEARFAASTSRRRMSITLPRVPNSGLSEFIAPIMPYWTIRRNRFAQPTHRDKRRIG